MNNFFKRRVVYCKEYKLFVFLYPLRYNYGNYNLFRRRRNKQRTNRN